MKASDPTHTYVLDAGGRYGMHPTWKSFGGDLTYVLFEPDPAEASRLRGKYGAQQNRVKVVACALHDRESSVKLHILSHKGMSSLYSPNHGSDWFKSRPNEGRIQSEITVQATTIDKYCVTHGISLDFAKIDTEGNECKILLGASSQLRNSLLGVRCEVYFDEVFDGIVTFPELHKLMLDAGFFLVNLDYNGQGVARNAYVQCGGRYGVLVGCDAVYLRRLPWLLNCEVDDKRLLGSRVLKCAAFCLVNHASDVAFDILRECRSRCPEALAACTESKLYAHVRLLAQKHIKNIMYQPWQKAEDLRTLYKTLFDEELKEMHEYFESLEINPD